MADDGEEAAEFGGDGEPDEIEPFDFDFENEEWVLAGDALRETIEFYLAAGDGDRSVAVKAALAAIRRRLENLEIVARARRWHYSVSYDGVDDPDLAGFLGKSVTCQDHTDVIFHGFWWALEQAARKMSEPDDDSWPQEHCATMDWVAGDFEFRSWTSVRLGPMKSTTVEGEARGVCFNRSGLPGTNRIQGVSPGALRRPIRRRDPHPNLPNAALQSWWQALPDETKHLPIDHALVPLCRAAFPPHYISRDRIRELTGPRKRGPKPSRGKETAE